MNILANQMFKYVCWRGDRPPLDRPAVLHGLGLGRLVLGRPARRPGRRAVVVRHGEDEGPPGVGFGRIVVSEIEARNTFVNLV